MSRENLARVPDAVTLAEDDPTLDMSRELDTFSAYCDAVTPSMLAKIVEHEDAHGRVARAEIARGKLETWIR